jgi:hypothetical protein
MHFLGLTAGVGLRGPDGRLVPKMDAYFDPPFPGDLMLVALLMSGLDDAIEIGPRLSFGAGTIRASCEREARRVPTSVLAQIVLRARIARKYGAPKDFQIFCKFPLHCLTVPV